MIAGKLRKVHLSPPPIINSLKLPHPLLPLAMAQHSHNPIGMLPARLARWLMTIPLTPRHVIAVSHPAGTIRLRSSVPQRLNQHLIIRQSHLGKTAQHNFYLCPKIGIRKPRASLSDQPPSPHPHTAPPTPVKLPLRPSPPPAPTRRPMRAELPFSLNRCRLNRIGSTQIKS